MLEYKSQNPSTETTFFLDEIEKSVNSAFGKKYLNEIPKLRNLRRKKVL